MHLLYGCFINAWLYWVLASIFSYWGPRSIQEAKNMKYSYCKIIKQVEKCHTSKEKPTTPEILYLNVNGPVSTLDLERGT